jgi:hypothetical protein
LVSDIDFDEAVLAVEQLSGSHFLGLGDLQFAVKSGTDGYLCYFCMGELN